LNLEVLFTQRILIIPVLLFSIVIHEYAHAYAAYRAGDMTAASQGRLTLNPLSHIDPIGTVILPLFLYLRGGFIIGWAKPVPVNPLRFRSSEWDIFVSLAGPGSNFAMVAISAILLKLAVVTRLVDSEVLIRFLVTGFIAKPEPLGFVLLFFIMINILLGIFNLIPIPPLDGSRVVYRLLASGRSPLAEPYAALEPYGFFILILILISPLWNLFGYVIDGASVFVLRLVF